MNYYTIYINHCLRFYIRHQNPKFHSIVDKENWNACDYVFKGLTRERQKMITYIYQEDSITERVEKYAEINKTTSGSVWIALDKVTKEIARRRGLL